MPELFEERSKLQTLIQEKITKRNEIRDEYRAKEKEFNGYLAKLREIRAKQAAEGREERQKEYQERQKQRAVDALDDQPHINEITLIEQTLKWCRNTMPQDTKKEIEDSKKTTDFNNPDGSMILLKKADRDEEFYYAPTKSKKKGAKGAAKKEESGKGKSIKHDVA